MPLDIDRLNTALEDWRSDAGYTDEQVSAFSGLPVRSLRELAQLGALSPILTNATGRGAKRAWDRWTVLRAAQIKAVTEAGFSLPVAARLAITWSLSSGSKDAFGYYSAWNDFRFAENGSLEYKEDSNSWEPFRADGTPVLASWLTDDWSEGQVDPDHDAYLKIINGEHLVAQISDYDCQIFPYGKPQNPFGRDSKLVRLGRLKDGGAKIVGVDYIDARRPVTAAQREAFNQVIDGESLKDILERFYVEPLGFLDGGGSYVDPAFMQIEEEERTPYDPEEKREDMRRRIEAGKAAEAAHVEKLVQTARSTIAVNMTLAARLAARSALGLTGGVA